MVTFRAVLLIGLLVWTSSMPMLLPVTGSTRFLAIPLTTCLSSMITAVILLCSIRTAPKFGETPSSVTRQARASRLRRASRLLEWLSVPVFVLLGLLTGVRIDVADTTFLGTILYLLTTFGPCTLWLFLLELNVACLLREPKAFSDRAGKSLFSEVAARLKLGSFAAWIQLLLPVCCFQIVMAQYKVLSDAAGPAISLACSCGAVLALVCYLPSLAGWWIGTTELPPEAQRRVTRLLSRCNVRLGAVRMVAGRHWRSAAVAGILPWGRQLWIGEALLHELEEEEVDMVLLHEFAHIKKHHFLFRLLPTAWACLAVLATNMGLESLPQTVGWTVIATSVNLVVAVGVFGGGMLLVSHASELEADRVACQLAVAHCDWANTDPALSTFRLASALRKVLAGGQDSARRSWLYPSLDDRIRSLAAAQANMRLASE